MKDKRKELETEALNKVHFAYSEMFDTVTEDEAYKLTRILTFSHMSVLDAETAHHTLLTVTSMMKVAGKRLVGWSCGIYLGSYNDVVGTYHLHDLRHDRWRNKGVTDAPPSS